MTLRMPNPLLALPLLACMALAVVVDTAGCKAGDDDDATRDIPPPEGCAYNSLANVTFSLTIHYGGEDYTPDILASLVKSWDPPALSFPFPGVVTEMGVDAETGLQVITFTEEPPEPPPGDDDDSAGDDDDSAGDDDDSADGDDDSAGDDDDSAGDDDDSAGDDDDDEDDPNWVRIVYSLPLGYELPASLGDQLGVHVLIDYTTGELISAFSMWEILETGEGVLLFMAEPSDTGLAYTPGELHPAFTSVTLRDRACPNQALFQCANPYNLSVEFETVVPGDDDDDSADTPPPPEPERFELWPTEHRDFMVGDLGLRVVNVWSYAYRDIDPACTGYDWTADRMSFFVIRTEFAP